MIDIEGRIVKSDDTTVIYLPLSQDEVFRLIDDLRRAAEEAKDHGTVWPTTVAGLGKDRLIIEVEPK